MKEKEKKTLPEKQEEIEPESKAADEAPQEETKPEARRLTWEEIMADEEYRGRFEEEVSKRTAQNLPDTDSVFSHLDELMYQAQSLKQRFPDFELLTELEDPVFVKLTAPQVGLNLESAYIARHWQELDRAAAEKSLQAVTRSIQSGAARPRELRGSQAASSLQADPGSMNRKQREELKKRIYDAAALGQKIPFGA